ncbi:MAG TPA: 4-alpha-glucanotransferase [Methylomirabilota bacterium]|nr:4-alpha-glucanotransferase [Methylomirabilota bacterium]
MTQPAAATAPAPMSPRDRASGLLLHVTSLPSRYGIGDLGPGALAWIDRLHDAGQRWWQTLPLGPTGYGDSPYQPLSTFAGNELLLSPDWLIEEGLLRAGDWRPRSFPDSTVDYGAAIGFKTELLGLLGANFLARARPELKAAFEAFRHDQRDWLDDYALFRAIKARHGGVHYLEWPAELVRREPAALARSRHALAEEIDAIRLAQFLFFRQAARLRAYGRSKGVGLIGDLPFFVSPDSSDVWANPALFLLDAGYRPRVIAGVPPDLFSADGQRWGNPIYDWEALRRTGYRWYIDRLRTLLTQVDLIRLDHFRGFAAAWHVPADAPTATAGQWVPGPGAALFEAIRRQLGDLPFIAEDLGLITPDVEALRDEFHLPGSLVLQFAFDGEPENPYLPANHPTNAVVYTGTHDNPTTREWATQLSPSERERLSNVLGRPAAESREAAWELIRLAWASRAALAIAPLQDVLNLGPEGRMNQPGQGDGNWTWRATAAMLADAPWPALRDLTARANRLRRRPPP